MKLLNFSKMHGLGNDFVVIDGISQSIDTQKLPIKQWADRHLGIGFDQLLIIKPSKTADVYCEIFNADGSYAEQCGNGMRCVARFVHENNLIQQKNISIETKVNHVSATIHTYDHIEVNMGAPRFEPSEIPFHADQKRKLYELSAEEGQPGFVLAVLSMGNPHAILQVTHIEQFPITNTGSLIAKHPAFPRGVNVGFMEVINRQHIRLRTFERGTGETLACGSNACAAAVAGILNSLLDKKVTIELLLGELTVSWEGDNQPVMLTGPASLVFSGSVIL